LNIEAGQTFATTGERLSSVQELSANIKAYLEKKPVPARDGGFIYSVYKYTDRHRLGAAFTALSLLGALIFSAFYVRQYHLTLRERDAARSAARRSEQLSTFLISIFELGDPFRHLSTPPTLNELLAQSVRQLRSGRFNLPADKALFSGTLAGIYSSQGDFKMSLSLYKEALAEVPPRDTAKRASIVTQIASAHVDLGQLPEARRELSHARDLQKATPSVPATDAAQWSIVSARERAVSGGFREANDLYSKALGLVANLPNTQGTVGLIQEERSLPLLLIGRSDDALKAANTALEIGRRLYHSDHPALAEMLMTRAKILTTIGRYEEAAKDLEEAERALISTFGPEHPSISDVLEDRGALAIEQRHFDQAVALFRRVFELRTRLLGPAHIETLRSYQNIGEAIQGKGDLPAAEVMLRKALRDFDDLGRGRVYSVGLLLNNLGLLLIQRGKLVEARPMLERALQVREEMHGEKSAWVAVTKANIANLDYREGKSEKARQELLEVINSLKASFGPRHPLWRPV
jgi:eukaryotic-like serine/threonine-protein kinase